MMSRRNGRNMYSYPIWSTCSILLARQYLRIMAPIECQRWAGIGTHYVLYGTRTHTSTHLKPFGVFVVILKAAAFLSDEGGTLS